MNFYGTNIEPLNNPLINPVIYNSESRINQLSLLSTWEKFNVSYFIFNYFIPLLLVLGFAFYLRSRYDDTKIENKKALLRRRKLLRLRKQAIIKQKKRKQKQKRKRKQQYENQYVSGDSHFRQDIGRTISERPGSFITPNIGTHNPPNYGQNGQQRGHAFF